ncbi:MAG: hypothetical protein ACXAEU_09155 [Candidatus Hodarchaeales archaeon]|jgi:hypothetical protein
MPTISETIIYIIFNLPEIILYYIQNFSLVLALLAIPIGLVVYYYGKKKNNQMMDSSYELVSKGTKEWLTKLKLVEEATIGRTYLAESNSGLPFSDIRFHFTLVKRHLIISSLASKLRNRRDYFLIEVEPLDKIVKRYQLEVLAKSDNKRIKAMSDLLNKLKMLEFGNRKLDNTFLVKVNDLELFKTIFTKKKQIISNLYAQRNIFVRFSLYPLQTPSLRIVVELNERIKPRQMMHMLIEFTNEITEIAKKGYMKQKTTSKVYRDESLEKSKEFYDRKPDSR